MNKKVLVICSLATLLFFIVSCAGDSSKNKTGTETSVIKESDNITEKAGDNLLTDKERLLKAQQELLDMPKLKGKTIKVFQNVEFYGNGRIKIALSNPDKPSDIDEYEFENDKWGEPNAIQISGDGDMESNLTPFSEIKFDVVPTIYKNWMDKAKTVEGATKPLDYVYFNLWVPTQGRYWSASTIEGSREKYSIDFNLDGSVKEFKKD